jgi:outer membrane biosynthesis protein TonB
VTLCFAPGDVDELEVAATPAEVTVGLGSGPGSPPTPTTPILLDPFPSKIPKVKPSTATVTGSLDKDIIRRIVRAHINEVRYCYNQGLARDPSLSGKVSIQFTISTTGSVAVSKVADSTIADEGVSNCIAKAVKRWTFPKPTGGIVVVTYPFVLESAE